MPNPQPWTLEFHLATVPEWLRGFQFVVKAPPDMEERNGE